LELLEQQRIIGADTAAESDLVYTTQTGGHRPDLTLQPMQEHGQR
jgi:hypothetical protein